MIRRYLLALAYRLAHRYGFTLIHTGNMREVQRLAESLRDSVLASGSIFDGTGRNTLGYHIRRTVVADTLALRLALITGMYR